MTELRKLCPFKGCRARTARSKFLCPHHWAMVPRDLQTAIYAAWRKYQANPRAAAGELIVAQQEALEAIGGN